MRIRLGWSTIFCTMLLLAAIKLAAAQNNDKAVTRIPHVDRAPRLEQFITGQPREAELVISDFRQREPQDGAPASRPTTAYLSYDNRNLYVVFVCQADPKTLRARLTKRDNFSGDDAVSVSLDTFHDKQRAYEFFSNPVGVQEDAITAEGVETDDFSFDTVWRSEARITADGYVVLFAIPFKSLRFHPSQEGTWGIALGRAIPGNRELSTWPHLTQKLEAYVPQFAGINAPANAHAARNMQFVPYVFAAAEKFLDTTTTPATIQKNQVYRGGLDSKIVIHDAITLDATINPDFSQIESDEPQVTTNQRYEVFFPEKRPFFLENSDFFETPETLLFTRRIVDPQFGLRLTGKIGNWKIGFLGADDRAPGNLEPLSSPLHGARAEVFAGRLQRLFSGSSNLGAMFTRRQFGDSSTTLYSVDTRLRLGGNWIFAGQYMQTNLIDPTNTPNVWGNAGFAELRHTGRKFTSSTSYTDRSAAFAGNDLGFFQRTNIRQASQNLGYKWRPEDGLITSYGPQLSAVATVDRSGQLQDWFTDMPMVFNLKGPSSFSFGRTEMMERYQGINFRKNSSYGSFSFNKIRSFGLNAFFSQGTEINFFPAASRLPSLGNEMLGSAGVTIRPGSHLQFEEKYIFSRLGQVAGNGVLFENHIARSKMNLQINRALSFRAIVDYNSLAGNPLLV
ncbi:MAG TPA: DUF5916 domain-containing protein, partial [Terriglobales bacterium]|nr:DUF5916 domain-containing protein [Terriglobales bacterium]